MIFSSCWVLVNIPYQVLFIAGAQRREWNLNQSETLHTVPVVDRVVRWSALAAARVAPERAHHRRDSPLASKESYFEKIRQASRSAQTHLQLAPTTFTNFPVCIMLPDWLPNEAGILFTFSSNKSSSPVIRLFSNVDHSRTCKESTTDRSWETTSQTRAEPQQPNTSFLDAPTSWCSLPKQIFNNPHKTKTQSKQNVSAIFNRTPQYYNYFPTWAYTKSSYQQLLGWHILRLIMHEPLFSRKKQNQKPASHELSSCYNTKNNKKILHNLAHGFSPFIICC